MATKGKGPNSENSGKAPAPKTQLSSMAQGVQECAQSTLFGAATLAQAIGSEEDTVRHLENYTGLQKLVSTMADGYEAATEDIWSLVASTLDVATERDHAFVARASQALADWTTKYQQAMRQGENRSIQDQLANWNQVWEAGIALSQKITSLTLEHEGSTASSEIFRTLLPACFQHVRVRTEATFAELNANLPSLLCWFVTPDQAGHILASIFTCLCNYNTEICGMAMAQTVVPVYTIPNTYRVQQSLWESMCRIIPGIARTGGNAAIGSTAVRQSGTAPATGGSGNLGTGTAGLANPWNVTAARRGVGSLDSHPLGIPPAGSIWANFHNPVPTVDLTTNKEPTNITPLGSSTPISAAPALEKHPPGKKFNVSKIKATHLIFDLQDRQEQARKNREAGNQAMVPDRTPGQDHGSGIKLPHGLLVMLPSLIPDRPTPVPSEPTTGSSQHGTKQPRDDDEIAEIPDEGELAEPPKKKKKKRKNKDASKDVPPPESRDDGPQLSTSAAEPVVDADEPTPVPETCGTLEGGDKVPKKKKKKLKKKEAGLEKLKLEQQEAKAKQMAKAMHRPIQRKQDFRAVRDYRKTLSAEVLESINGADHSSFLLEKMQIKDNYMSQKNGHDRNLMTVTRLLTRIAKYATDPEKRLREAQTVIKSTFPMVQGMPPADKCSPELVVRVLMDCWGNPIDCEQSKYRKEQNIGLHDVIHPVAMARETHTMEGIPTTVKAHHAYWPFCAYAASNHRAVNNHVRMHFRAILVCGWPGCYFVHMQSLRMVEHSSEVHGMARAKPARGEKCD